MAKETKLPIGVIPQWRYEELQDSVRILELAEAIRRYILDGRDPHWEWAEEILALTQKQRSSPRRKWEYNGHGIVSDTTT